jgi:hypothetical protein
LRIGGTPDWDQGTFNFDLIAIVQHRLNIGHSVRGGEPVIIIHVDPRDARARVKRHVKIVGIDFIARLPFQRTKIRHHHGIRMPKFPLPMI